MLTFFWDDSTKYLNIDNLIENSINSACTDISKTKVDAVFKTVFDYDQSIDPRIYKGQCVIKSDANAKHDGKIITCPISEPDPKFVYQKLIDNSIENGLVKDLRTPIIGNEIPFVYFKIKKSELRFTNEIDRVKVHQTNEIFSEYEIEKIISFCKVMGLDYGELDILRDNNNKRIYIVDVNKTPWGPPNKISKADAQMVIEKISKSFLKFLNTI